MTRAKQILSSGPLPKSLGWVLNHDDNYASDNFTTAKEFLDYAKKSRKALSPEEAKALVKRWAGASLSVQVVDETEKNMKACGC